MTEPLVSVIIPTHNRPELLRRAVKSAVEQTYQNIEIIIIDDVGNVPTDLIQSGEDNRIQYIRIPETYWISENRNAGIKAAKGKYIASLDDDDIWFPEYLSKMIPVMETDESIGFACANGYEINDLFETPTKQLFPHLQKEMRGNLFAHMIWDCFVQPSLMIIRKDMFTKYGDYKNIRGEDLDLIMRFSAFTNIYYTPEKYGVWYRRSDTSSASETAQSTLDGRLEILTAALIALWDVERMARRYDRVFSLKEKTAIYLQRYYFHCYSVAVYFMFNDPDRYLMLKELLKMYPLLSPLTLLTPLCVSKPVRDTAQRLKRQVM